MARTHPIHAQIAAAEIAANAMNDDALFRAAATLRELERFIRLDGDPTDDTEWRKLVRACEGLMP